MGLLTSIRRPLLPPQSSLRRGLVAYYTFDEQAGTTVLDRSGNGNTGTLSGTVAGFWTPSGKMGGAGNFNGTNNYVTIPDAPMLNLVAPFSIGLWLKYTTVTNLVVLEKNTNSGFSLQINGPVKINVGGPSASTVTTASPNDGAWHQVMFVIAGYGSALSKAYLDGVDNTAAGATTLAPSYGTSQPVYIGGRAGSFNYAGVADEIPTWNRALSSAEIQMLYAKGKGYRLV